MSTKSIGKEKNGGILAWIEKVGNKIPHPFLLFFYLTLIIVILSCFLNIIGVNVENPATSEIVSVRNLLSAEGIVFILENLITNFSGFAPLGLILSMTIGIGVAEHSGLISTFMRNSILGASPKLVTIMIMFIGICGNLASDAAIVVVPVISAMIFVSMDRHPLAGIAIGYAATTAGFSANLMISGTDALLSGISTEAVKIIDPNMHVGIADNWYFMIASTFLLSVVGAIVTERFIEPRLGKYNGKIKVNNDRVTDIERKGLKYAGLFTVMFILLIAAATIPENSFLRNPETGSIIQKSPLINSIAPILIIWFVSIGIIYGKTVGTIKSAADVPAFMTKSIGTMSSYIVLVFIIGQFIAYFNWSNIGYVIAVYGAELLEFMNLKGIPLFIMFILLCSFINLFIGSGSAKWTLLAPIFIPMFYMLGYNPALTQLLYRIGDSTTNIISPLFSYIPIIIALAQQYDKKYGMGTVISTMIPYTIAMMITWTLLAIVWFFFKIPLGPGVGIFI
ncbi:AbgT family transporter [Romboutsia weinsteinii]|uniref:AbgT family transporter n=1 Tax=Romboutsia weinsteinii TaxID=2020949 RepID=A0A371J352_9FIRM|nr:AbgT family transporter [Romboutsia weinsteinii]RDY27220.1 AbgT family transporter [Romboutsia weinsteinii]